MITSQMRVSALIGVPVAAVAAVIGFIARDLPTAVFAAVAFGLLASTAYRLRHYAASPAVLFAALNLAIGVGGLCVGNSLGVGGSGAVTNTLDPSQLALTFDLFAIVVSCALLPSLLLVPTLAPDPGDALPSLPKKFDRVLVIASTALAIACVVVVGPAWLLSRSSRFADTSTASNLAYLACLGGLVLLGAPLARLKGWRKLAVAPGLLLYVTIFFSAASRYLCLVPICLLAGLLFAGVRRSRLTIAGITACVLAVLLLPIPLFLRGSTVGGGVVPYIQWLGQFSLSNGNIASSFNNVLIGYRISGATAFTEPRIPPLDFWVSVNPLPGTWVGWDLVWPHLRLNNISPYSGMGELGNQGWLLCIAGSLMLGLLLAGVQILGARIGSGPIARVLATAVLAIVLIDAIQFTQYNLRTAFRLLYYAVGLELACVLAVATWRSVHRRILRRARHRAEPSSRTWVRPRA